MDAVSDRLYLSCRLRGANDANLLRHFEKLLALFPFSKLAKRGPVLRVYAVEHKEPPAFEREFSPGAAPANMIAMGREFFQPDCCMEIDAAWDLWQLDKEWKLGPAPVILSALGSKFEDREGEHLRVDLGLDSHFLPNEKVEGSLRMGQSNLRSLLHFVNDAERSLSLESRTLWSESGVNFAGMLAETIARFNSN
jgi:hypothetical protein